MLFLQSSEAVVESLNLSSAWDN